MSLQRTEIEGRKAWVGELSGGMVKIVFDDGEVRFGVPHNNAVKTKGQGFLNAEKAYAEVEKYNEAHDAQGRFASTGGGGGASEIPATPEAINPDAKVQLVQLFRGVEGSATDPMAAARATKGGDLGDGIYFTPSQELAGSYGGGAGASVRAGTRIVHTYDTSSLFPEDVAYMFGGAKEGEEARLISGNGIELWHGDWGKTRLGSGSTDPVIERALEGIKVVVGTPDSIGVNQIVVRDKSILMSPTKKSLGGEASGDTPSPSDRRLAALEKLMADDRFTWQSGDITYKGNGVDKFNPDHDPKTGEFASGSGGGATPKMSAEEFQQLIAETKRQSAKLKTDIATGLATNGFVAGREGDRVVIITPSTSDSNMIQVTNFYQGEPTGHMMAHADLRDISSVAPEFKTWKILTAEEADAALDPAVYKYNPNHDERGRFASGEGAGQGTGAGTGTEQPGGLELTAGGRSGSASVEEAQAAAAAAARGEKAVDGLPVKPIQFKDGSYFVPGPNGTARQAARDYMAKAELDYHPPTKYEPVDPEKATAIADAFEQMKHDPTDPQVVASYNALINETLSQWETIKGTGLQVSFIKADQADPYGESPRLAIEDIRDNNHFWVYPTSSGFGTGAEATAAALGNPLLRKTGETLDGHEMVANDVFRIVHDYFGHFKEGNGFRAAGEDNAWRSHSAMYSDLAKPAMTAETRGQNSWVNFGPYGASNRKASGGDTHYAPQKIGRLPDWVMKALRWLDKYNPYHGEHGRFASAEGATAHLDTVIASALKEKGGFTFNPVTVTAPHHGYAVGGYGTRDIYNADGFDVSHIRDYLNRNKDALKEKFLGGWIDNGKVYLDVTKVFPENERTAAIAAGKERNQIAIADLTALNAGKMDEAFIDTGGTGKAALAKRTAFLLDPRAMTAEEMYAAIMAMIEQLK